MCKRSILEKIVKEEMGYLLFEHSRDAGLPVNIYLDSMVDSFMTMVESPSFHKIRLSNKRGWVKKTISRIKELDLSENV